MTAGRLFLATLLCTASSAVYAQEPNPTAQPQQSQPVMPAASAKLLDILGIPDQPEMRNFAALATRIKAGTRLPSPSGIFPRYIEPTAA